jgi:glycosyltransferase involved in cell wall biosynthesis
VYLSRHVGRALREFGPDLVVWSVPARLFGMSLLLASDLAKLPVVTVFTENYGMHEFDWRKRGISIRQRLHAIAFQLLRGPLVRAVCRRSTVIVASTPQTREILLMLFGPREKPRVEAKILTLPLGFHPAVYGWDPSVRQATRRELGLADDDVVIVMSSRFMPHWKTEYITASVEGIIAALTAHPAARAVIVGMGDDEFSDQYRRRIQAGPVAGRVQCLQWADQPRLNAIYNAGDIALFGNASISCQAALGTGLAVCLADNGSMNHLVTLPRQGFFFRPRDSRDIAAKLSDALAMFEAMSGADRTEFRRSLAKESRWLSYDRGIAKVLKAVAERRCHAKRGIPAGGHPQDGTP